MIAITSADSAFHLTLSFFQLRRLINFNYFARASLVWNRINRVLSVEASVIEPDSRAIFKSWGINQGPIFDLSDPAARYPHFYATSAWISFVFPIFPPSRNFERITIKQGWFFRFFRSTIRSIIICLFQFFLGNFKWKFLYRSWWIRFFSIYEISK